MRLQVAVVFIAAGSHQRVTLQGRERLGEIRHREGVAVDEYQDIAVGGLRADFSGQQVEFVRVGHALFDVYPVELVVKAIGHVVEKSVQPEWQRAVAADGRQLQVDPVLGAPVHRGEVNGCLHQRR